MIFLVSDMIWASARSSHPSLCGQQGASSAYEAASFSGASHQAQATFLAAT